VRKKHALTRDAFAQRFGLSADAVKEWENEPSPIRPGVHGEESI
jgi:DNA-binding transcriptional regulator YiaG